MGRWRRLRQCGGNGKARKDDKDEGWRDGRQGEWTDLAGLAANAGGEGFWVLTKSGRVHALGGAPDLGAPKLGRRYVAMAGHPRRSGFWVLDSTGKAYAFGAAKRLGSARFPRAVGMAANRSGSGYWIVSKGGRVAAFGNANPYGGLQRFDVTVDRIAVRDDADGYLLHTTAGKWVSFPNEWSRRPRRDDSTHTDRQRRDTTPNRTSPDRIDGISRTFTQDGVRLATVDGITVARSIAEDVLRLLNAARRDGRRLGGWGYRSTARQIELRRAHCGTTRYAIYEMPSSQCSPPTARPGSSMHEKGLAIDFYKKGRNGAAISIAGTREFRWLKRHAAKYGLYNLPSEPWHWSTNGH